LELFAVGWYGGHVTVPSDACASSLLILTSARADFADGTPRSGKAPRSAWSPIDALFAADIVGQQYNGVSPAAGPRRGGAQSDRLMGEVGL
jgi:hypothetical protein